MSETRFSCEQCGAGLAYAPGTDSLRCDHCGHDNPIPRLESGAALIEFDYRAALRALAGSEGLDETRTIKCSACAAEFSESGTVASERCPYCGGPFVAASVPHRQFRPRALVPFAITAKDARVRLRDWLGSLWFAPRDVARFVRDDGRLAGVYVPYWTFDAETSTRYAGERGTAHQVPRRVTASEQGRMVERTEWVTEIRWSPVQGVVNRRFDDVLVLGSRTLPEHVVNRLGSWRLDALVPYQDAYLSGFRGEAYEIGLEEAFSQAQRIMAPVIAQDIRFDIGGNAQRVHHQDTRFGMISFKHVLLPIWSAAYRYRDKTYRFVVNGQTGEVQGERPYSALKIAALVLAVLALLAIAAWLYLDFQRRQDPAPDPASYPSLPSYTHDRYDPRLR